MPASDERLQSRELRAWRARIFVSTWLAYAGYYFGRKTFYVVKGTMAGDLGFDAHSLAYLGTAYLAAYALGQFASASIGHRRGARVVLIAGMSLSLLANLAMAYGPGFAVLAGVMLVNGASQGTGWPGTIGTMAFWTRRKERGTILGVWSTCYQIGGVAASAWAAFWLVRVTWQGAYVAGAAVLGLALVAVIFWQRNRPEDVGLSALVDEPATAANPLPAQTSARAMVATTLLVGVYYFFTKFVRYALWSWTPYFLAKNFHLTTDNAGYLSTLFDLAGFVGVIFAGVISDRLFRGRRGTIALLMLIGMTLAAVLLYFFGDRGVWPFAAGLSLIGFMLYGPDALLSGAGAIDIGSKRAALAAAGVINGMGSLGSVSQEFLVANVYEQQKGDLHGVFALLVGAALLSTLAIAVVVWRNAQGKSDL